MYNFFPKIHCLANINTFDRPKTQLILNSEIERYFKIVMQKSGYKRNNFCVFSQWFFYKLPQNCHCYNNELMHVMKSLYYFQSILSEGFKVRKRSRTN